MDISTTTKSRTVTSITVDRLLTSGIGHLLLDRQGKDECTTTAVIVIVTITHFIPFAGIESADDLVELRLYQHQRVGSVVTLLMELGSTELVLAGPVQQLELADWLLERRGYPLFELGVIARDLGQVVHL